MSDGYVFEHRKVAWDVGIFTDPSLHIHHKDADKKNNDPSNLEPKTASEHHRDHAIEGGVTNQYGHFQVVSGTCSINGCEDSVESRGWCSGHYTRYLRSGDPGGHAKHGYKMGVKVS